MKKHFIRIATAFFGCAILAIAATGQAADQVVVRIPYEFGSKAKPCPQGHTASLAQATRTTESWFSPVLRIARAC
jgi:hypothetical protein